MVKKVNDKGGKATKRHAAIAANRKKEEESMKMRLSENKIRNKTQIKERRSDIGKLPKEERSVAKEELSKFIDEIKVQEAVDKEAYKNFVNERKAKERAKRGSS